MAEITLVDRRWITWNRWQGPAVGDILAGLRSWSRRDLLDGHAPKGATPATVAANRDAVALYDMDDQQDFSDADRGFIAGFPDDNVVGADGRVLCDRKSYGYITDDAAPPDTVNPSLWRQSQVIRRGGLYQVVEGL